MKALIRYAVTAQLICAFVFTYAKSRFSHDATQYSNARVYKGMHCFLGVNNILLNSNNTGIYSKYIQNYQDLITSTLYLSRSSPYF